MRGFVGEFLEQLVLVGTSSSNIRRSASGSGIRPSARRPGRRLPVFVKVRNLTEQEESWIYSFLDASLDPDVEIHVVRWVHNPYRRRHYLVRKLGGATGSPSSWKTSVRLPWS
jgi:hypothetical protein